ncbi:sigma-70 family RNA polymerase sigma factor [Sphingosinicellaceae bacterium]|nr:sigma-70 family RNA polymerase sigma factor [Sphingosinicellaceae bacterium]
MKIEPLDEDARLMARVANGDAQAFTALVLKLHGGALGLATRVLGNRADAEDVVQVALARLWTLAGRYDPERGSVGAWFRRVLVNLCLDRRRSIRLVQNRVTTTLDDAWDIADPGPDPAEAAAANARARRIDSAMAMLNPRQRAAIALFHGEGASMAEVAAALDTTPKAVEGLLGRARMELKSLLASDAPERER